MSQNLSIDFVYKISNSLFPLPPGSFWSTPLCFVDVIASGNTPPQYVFLGFGGLGGNNGRQSWLKDDVLVSLSTPGPTRHMLLGAVGPHFVGMATYGPRKMLSCAILAAVSALC